MSYNNWDAMLYTTEEISGLYNASDGFNDDINSNSKARNDDESFASFIGEGIDELIREDPEFVAGLI